MTPPHPAPPPAYALDIETDTSAGGLDPRTSRITAIGVAGRGWSRTFTGPERALLADADRFLARLAPGLLVTWNGSSFDLPFLVDRAAVAAVPLHLVIDPDPGLALPHGPAPGHRSAYRGRWWDHEHVDAYLELRPLAHRSVGTARLKAFAARHGIECLEPDPTRLHELSPEALRRYVASDARATLALADHYGLTGTRLGPLDAGGHPRPDREPRPAEGPLSRPDGRGGDEPPAPAGRPTPAATAPWRPARPAA